MYNILQIGIEIIFKEDDDYLFDCLEIFLQGFYKKEQIKRRSLFISWVLKKKFLHIFSVIVYTPISVEIIFWVADKFS